MESENLDNNEMENMVRELDGDVKDIYEKIKKFVDEISGKGKFNPTLVQPLLFKLIKTIQELSEIRKMDGAHKKQLALTVIQHIIHRLTLENRIDKTISDGLLVGLETFGPTLIDLGASVIKKIENKIEDLMEDGCNCCLPIKSKSKTTKQKGKQIKK